MSDYYDVCWDILLYAYIIKILLEQKAQISEMNQKNENEMEKQKIINYLDEYANKNNKRLIENAKEKKIIFLMYKSYLCLKGNSI